LSGGRFALLVASHRYTDPGLARLVSPAKDVEALRGVLGDPAIGGFDVQTSVNRPTHEVARTVEAFFADRTRDDLLLFYFTGHGLKDDRGRLFFAMKNTERRYVGATALAATFLHDVMERSRSRCNILLLDCCYSGAFATSRTAKADPAIHTPERFQSRGRAVLTASDSIQFSFEGDVTGRRRPLSVFTRLIVDGLASGDADRDENGYVDLDELYDYVDDRMREIAPEQRPGKWQWDVQGRIVIAKNPHWPSTTPQLPPRRVPSAANGKPAAVALPSRRVVPRAPESSPHDTTGIRQRSVRAFILVAITIFTGVIASNWIYGQEGADSNTSGSPPVIPTYINSEYRDVAGLYETPHPPLPVIDNPPLKVGSGELGIVCQVSAGSVTEADFVDAAGSAREEANDIWYRVLPSNYFIPAVYTTYPFGVEGQLLPGEPFGTTIPECNDMGD